MLTIFSNKKIKRDANFSFQSQFNTFLFFRKAFRPFSFLDIFFVQNQKPKILFGSIFREYFERKINKIIVIIFINSHVIYGLIFIGHF